MDDPNSLPVIPKKRIPKPETPIGVQRSLFLLGGVAIGVLVVIATLKMAAQTTPVVYHRSPERQQQIAPHELSPKPADPAPKTTPNAEAGNNDLPKDKPADPGKPGTATIPPYNPFGNNLVAMPPHEISGQIDPHKGPDPNMPTTEQAPPKGMLLSIRLDVADPNAAVKALQSVASRLGGSAIQFDETATKLDAEGAILFVPATKAEEAQKQIGGVGTIVVSDKWSGNAGDRLDRAEETANDRLTALRGQRQELLIKYFEDAPQIQHIDEDTARIQKCVGSLRARKPGADTAMIKIKFLG